MKSYWSDSTTFPSFPRLTENISTDVCIIGAGITGIATAYILSKSNLNVTLIDKSSVASGVTCNTTAKITSQHGLLYKYLIDTFGEVFAKKYLESNEEAIKTICDIVQIENIDCNLKNQNSFVYTCNKYYVKKIEDEVNALNSLGFKAELISNTQLPFEVLSSIKFSNQYQFNPCKYLLSLINTCKDRVNIFENSKATNIKHSKSKYEISCNGKTIIANNIVLATHYPIKNFPRNVFS